MWDVARLILLPLVLTFAFHSFTSLTRSTNLDPCDKRLHHVITHVYVHASWCTTRRKNEFWNIQMKKNWAKNPNTNLSLTLSMYMYEYTIRKLLFPNCLSIQSKCYTVLCCARESFVTVHDNGVRSMSNLIYILIMQRHKWCAFI